MNRHDPRSSARVMGHRWSHFGLWPTVFSASGALRTARLKRRHVVNGTWRNNR
jgi:hypothetical protein